ncbi:hypothetical protein [Streptomyces roseoviridis]|uniref:Tat pathway signal sequence domain protein n=1 Tax=Streptomyces roseoviridis TaxID=67361 RepID=A0ABV5QXU7_9ACTN
MSSKQAEGLISVGRRQIVGTSAAGILLLAGMVAAPPPSQADTSEGRATDVAYVNPYSIPCDGVQYAVRNGYVSTYRASAGTAQHVNEGYVGPYTFKAVKGESTTNTVTDTHTVSVKLAGKLVGADKLAEGSGELSYTYAHTISEAKSVTFSTENSFTIVAKGGYIEAVPEYVKTQASADYWTRSRDDGCEPKRSKDRMSMDAVTSMGWRLLCGPARRPCVAGKDYEAKSVSAPTEESTAASVYLHGNMPHVPYRHVQECHYTELFHNRRLCDFSLPERCQVNVAGYREFRATLECPTTVHFKGYRIMGKDYHVSVTNGQWPSVRFDFRADDEKSCLTGRNCDWGQVAYGSMWTSGDANRETVNVVTPLY